MPNFDLVVGSSCKFRKYLVEKSYLVVLYHSSGSLVEDEYTVVGFDGKNLHPQSSVVGFL